MKASVLAVTVLVALPTAITLAQAPATPPAAVAAQVNAARKAAGQDHSALFNNICTPPPAPQPPGGGRQGGANAQQGPPPAPPRSEWAAEPAKVFDNLYFVGEKEYTAWAVTTSAGIIIIDPLFEYSVEDQVIGGLKKLGLDPGMIRYVVVSHAHRDHVAGAAALQNLGARVLMAEEDWVWLANDPARWPKAKRDIVVNDGYKLTLGDTTLTLYLTPGHTPGTISTLIPVKDGARTHTALLWGGTGFNWRGGGGNNRYITPARPAKWWYDQYAASAAKMKKITQPGSVDVVLSNHPQYDNYAPKQAALATRGAGQPHPWVIGAESVQRFLTVAEECAKAGPLWVNPPR